MAAKPKAPQVQPFRLDSRTVRSALVSIALVAGLIGVEVTDTEIAGLTEGIMALGVLAGNVAAIYYRVNRRAQ